MAENKQNIEDILDKDGKYKEGVAAYRELETKAHEESGRLAQELIEKIIKKEEKFNISVALMALAKTLTYLASYLYDSEEEFLSAVQKARTSVVSDVIPALLDPTPCGNCEACKNGNPMECVNPDVRSEYTETRFLPIVANMLIEYDMFNKVLHMYAFKNEAEKGSSEVQNENGTGPNAEAGQTETQNQTENGSNSSTES